MDYLLTREEWLQQGADLLRSNTFKATGYDCPQIQVSVGFPGRSAKAIGQCWTNSVADDNLHHIFISPIIADASRALDILAHEMVHATVGVKEGHNKVFRKCAVGIGLTGKMTATVAGEELTKQLDTWVKDILGPYPHGKLNPSDNPKKKQGTRMVKIECASACTELKVRLSRKWIDECLTPLCPVCSEPLEEI